MGLISFILNKQKLVYLEKIQAFLLHQREVRGRVGVSQFLAGELGYLRHGDAV